MRWKGGRAWGQSGMMFWNQKSTGPLYVHQPSCLYVFASGTWIAFCCGSLCWEGHEGEPATVPYSGQKVRKRGWRWGAFLGRKASFLQGLLLPAPQCRHRSEVGLGGIQPCVSCTFKAAFEGMKSSRFFHFRESACEKGGGGENSRRGCPGPTKLLLPSSWAVALCKPISQEPLHLIPTGQSHHSLRISGERTQVPVLGPSVQGASFLGKHSL